MRPLDGAHHTTAVRIADLLRIDALERTRAPGHAFAMREHWSKVAPSAGSAQGFCASGCGCLVRVRVRVTRLRP